MRTVCMATSFLKNGKRGWNRRGDNLSSAQVVWRICRYDTIIRVGTRVRRRPASGAYRFGRLFNLSRNQTECGAELGGVARDGESMRRRRFATLSLCTSDTRAWMKGRFFIVGVLTWALMCAEISIFKQQRDFWECIVATWTDTYKLDFV